MSLFVSVQGQHKAEGPQKQSSDFISFPQARWISAFNQQIHCSGATTEEGYSQVFSQPTFADTLCNSCSGYLIQGPSNFKPPPTPAIHIHALICTYRVQAVQVIGIRIPDLTHFAFHLIQEQSRILFLPRSDTWIPTKM